MQTIGERLEEARKRKGISIREAAEATKIRGDYLHKFESNQFDIRLPEIYVRGFLRTYASFLKLPGEKIINDYHGLGLGDPKAGRQLNREVYGRMDLSVASAKANPGDEPRPEPAKEAPAPGDHDTARNPATFRPRSTDGGSPVDRTLLIKAGALIGGAVLLIVLVVWGITALVSSKPSEASAVSAKVTAAESPISIILLQPMRIKVVRRSDETELFQAQQPLAAGFRRDFPEVPLILTAEYLEGVQIEYKGVRYNIGKTGRDKVVIDPAGLK